MKSEMFTHVYENGLVYVSKLCILDNNMVIRHGIVYWFLISLNFKTF